jgi:ABC-type transport system involved in cytochrome c biogenesis ATPase subunit
MLKSAKIRDFTVFGESDVEFSSLNIVHGVNGAGKTHLLKLLYAGLQVVGTPTSGDERPVRSRLNRTLAEKLLGVFKPERLGNLARHGARSAHVSLRLSDPAADLEFSVGSRATAEVDVQQVPPEWRTQLAAYLPPRELLSLQPEFVGMATDLHLPFDDTWLDTSRLLNRPLSRGPKGRALGAMIERLEGALGGTLVTDTSGHFKVRRGKVDVEAHLLAEGLRKLATVIRLLDNKSLQDKGYLFWDEPEANLNPRLIREVAAVLVEIAAGGTQVFLATHSLFLLRELELQLATKGNSVSTRYVGLADGPSGVQVSQGDTIADSGDIVALDESLSQSERYLEADT